MGIFPDAQGQLTLQSEVEPGQNANSSEILWLFLLPARMKKIQSKMKLLEWPQHLPHYNSMGAICCHGNQSSDPICLKTYGRRSPTPMLLHVKSNCNRPASLRDIQVPGEKPPDTPASRTWLVPHVTRAPCEARTHSGEMIK